MNVERIRYPLSVLIAATLSVATAQTTFQSTYGTFAAEDGVRILPIAGGYQVVERVFDPATKQYQVGVHAISSNGTVGAQTLIPLSGGIHIQAGVHGVDNTLILAGSRIAPDSTDQDMLLVELDASNNIIWTTIIELPDDQELLDVVELADGTIAACGFVTIGGQHDALITLFDANGSQLWSITSGLPLNDEANSLAVETGTIMIAGRQMNFGGDSDCLFMRADEQGNLIWTTSWGGVKDDEGRKITRSSSGKFIMAGTTKSYGQLDMYQRRKENLYLVKIDLQGDTLWTAAIGDTLVDRRALTLDIANNGDLLVAGERELGKEVDAVVVRCDDQAHVIWQHAYDEDDWDRALDIHSDPLTDGFVACGWSFGPLSRQVLLLRKDALGN